MKMAVSVYCRAEDSKPDLQCLTCIDLDTKDSTVPYMDKIRDKINNAKKAFKTTTTVISSDWDSYLDYKTVSES